MVKNWVENKNYCEETVKKNPKLIMTKKNKGGFDGNYLTWTLVYKWMVKTYDFVFEVNEIKTTNDGANGYVKATLIVNEEDKQYKQTLALTLDTYIRNDGTFYQETPEQLQMRVFVKLVANITGFGFHLWEKIIKKPSSKEEIEIINWVQEENRKA